MPSNDDDEDVSESSKCFEGDSDEASSASARQHPLVLAAYQQLWPGEPSKCLLRLEYAGRFRDYGANIQLSGREILVKLSRRWQNISQEIQIGLIQELLLKLLRKKGMRGPQTTMNIDLYNCFVRNLHIAIPKVKSDPLLEASFQRVNDHYFVGLVETPNLVWGKNSHRTFGAYNFKNDTITMNPLLAGHDPKYLDYVMFHELLHKQRKFERKGAKTHYHDALFKRAEAVFENHDQIEQELNHLTRKTVKQSAAYKFFRFF
ncbi:DUF45 domain-containing protein [Candidatus Woesearchaeota archaeon]|nr:DUF45 domain-containing protein [Candidatus Woesearchaeota archaeon]